MEKTLQPAVSLKRARQAVEEEKDALDPSDIMAVAKRRRLVRWGLHTHLRPRHQGPLTMNALFAPVRTRRSGLLPFMPDARIGASMVAPRGS